MQYANIYAIDRMHTTRGKCRLGLIKATSCDSDGKTKHFIQRTVRCEFFDRDQSTLDRQIFYRDWSCTESHLARTWDQFRVYLRDERPCYAYYMYLTEEERSTIKTLPVFWGG